MMNLRYCWNRVVTSFIALGFCFGCTNPLQRSNVKSNKPLSPDDCLIRNQAKRDVNTIEFEVDFIKGITNKSSTISQSQPIQYVFEGELNQVLYIEPTVYTAEQKICLNILASGVQPIYSGVLQNLQIPLRIEGKYAIDLSMLQGATSYDLTLRLEKSTINSHLSSSRPPTKLPAHPFTASTHINANPPSSSIERVYEPFLLPQLRYSNTLQSIIDEIIYYRTKKGKVLRIDNISITLIDTKEKEFAHYEGDELRFPASVIKMFWMVIFYDLWNSGNLTQIEYDNSLEDMKNMMLKSDNKAASNIVDLISDAPSKSDGDYYNWLGRRERMSDFFQKARYADINISQKTFPFPFPKLGKYGISPQGYELRMRGDPNNPIRNKISTDHAARLMYEIVDNKAIPSSNYEMRQLLTRDLSYDWNKINPQMEFNPVLRFFGEYLPRNTTLISKAGWTSKTRQEVAYIESGNTKYILAIFLDNSPDLAQDITLFPDLSCIVFRRMAERECDRNRYKTK
ncbi:MAG: serine hydrolase [Cyanobacteria bacterium SBLK]|nr:serine hydrolase [Cyanobacteria bacterium SBLK]